jgi:translation initiation factor 2B subunit (eIF-2B alpha/beta/delta family)/8-oxo-dGTP pyrophosphatase MutT (NUDIX family)
MIVSFEAHSLTMAATPNVSTTAAAARIKRVISCFLVTQAPVTRTTSTTRTSTTFIAKASSASPITPTPVTRIPTNDLISSPLENGKGRGDRDALRIAVFHRQSTMPTFPSHWAACSGSIEEGETPTEAARREIQEETSAFDDESGSAKEGPPPPFMHSYGLYVDVPFPSSSPTNQRKNGDGNDDVDTRAPNRIIRVYPFLVDLPREAATRLQMGGTEHDAFQWVSLSELERLEPAVPGLAQAFHHASMGAYLSQESNHQTDNPVRIARKWASDRESGANAMAMAALRILAQFEHPRQKSEMLHLAECMIMMRPSMVAITNSLMRFKALVAGSVGVMADRKEHPAAIVSKQLEEEIDRAVQRALDVLRSTFKLRRRDPSGTRDPSDPLHVVVFSRSSTLVSILRHLGAESNTTVTCSKSTPGNEGVIMAQDLSNVKIQAQVVDDAALLDPSWWRDHWVDAVLVGSDCILAHAVYNKVGTQALAEAANRARVPVICCGDTFKAWDDSFPPPVEDIFEPVPRRLLQHVVH